MKMARVKGGSLCASHSRRHTAPPNKYDFRWHNPHHRDACEVFGKDFTVSFGSVLDKVALEFSSIAIDHEILSGSPRIAGTRIPLYMVLDAIQHTGSIEGVLTSYPDLTREQVRDAVSFAGAVLEQPIEHEP